MARTPEGARLTAQHRARQIALRAAALRDMTTLYRVVDPTALANTIQTFAEAAATTTQARFRDSAVMAARYYEQFRQTEGVTGAAAIVIPDPPPRQVATNVIRGAALSGIINARKAGFSVDAAAQNGFTKAAGSTSNMVLGASREVITGAAQGDGRSRGWQRVTGADPCVFCSERAGVTMRTPDFEAHDHCACQAEPNFF